MLLRLLRELSVVSFESVIMCFCLEDERYLVVRRDGVWKYLVFEWDVECMWECERVAKEDVEELYSWGKGS